MRTHERRAIERALDVVLARYWDVIPKAERIKLPREIVNVAMIRAGRTYDYHTEAEALEYAGHLMDQFVKEVGW